MTADDLKHTIAYRIDGGRAFRDLEYHLPEDALYKLVVAYYSKGNAGLVDVGSAILDDAVERLMEQYEQEEDDGIATEKWLDDRDRARACNEEFV